MEKQKSFEGLNLNEMLIKGVYLYGFTQPSSIQIKGIESINTGKDCLLQSQSGTGKTATYLLGVLNRIEDNDKTQAIILAPTRELCNQIYDVAVGLTQKTKIKIQKSVGGTNIGETKQSLRSANVIIGTLGRLHHMIMEKTIHLHSLKILVMDEADDLLTDGITDKLSYILQKVPTGIQSILISATMNPNVFNESKKILHDPLKVLLKNSEVVVDLISQFYLDVESEELKFETLLDLYNLLSTSQVIIFCNTVKKVDWLKENLEKQNFTITCIHSKMTQQERDNIIKEFRDGKTRLLLTTDLLSRGIDIPQVNLVVNYDLPEGGNAKETYIHRIGRCGRFGKKGVSISMVKSEDQSDIKTLQKMKQIFKMDIKEMPDDIEKYLN
jgi:superfamily II DNA/RNA helicase